MKYLKKFNESNGSDTLTKFYKWVKENITYTNDDILYYFSEFTDKFEWKYEVGSQFYEKYFLEKGKINISFYFYGHINSNSRTNVITNCDGYIELSNELKEFKKCLYQFKSLEENIEEVDDNVSIETTKITICVSFKKLIPEDILNKFKQELKEEEEQRKKNKTGPNFGIPNNEINEILSMISYHDIINNLDTDIDPDIIDVEFDDWEVDLRNNGDRVICIFPNILVDGAWDEDLSNTANPIYYNYDKEEFENYW